MKKRNRGIIAIVCIMALLISSFATYTARTNVKAAAPDYSGLTYAALANNENNEFDQKLYDAEIAVANGTVNFNVKQFQGAGYGQLYLALGGQKIRAHGRF